MTLPQSSARPRSHRRAWMLPGLLTLLLVSPLLPAVGPLNWLAGQAARADIAWDGLYSDQSPFYMSPVAPAATQSVTVKLRTYHGNATSANTKDWDTAASKFDWVPLSIVGQDATGKYDYWQGSIPASSSTKYYRFQINNGSQTVWLNAGGVSASEPSSLDFWIIPGFTTPAWSQNAIYYQIFPDRFYDGNKKNNLPVMSGPSKGPCPKGSYLYGTYCAYTHASWTDLPDQPPMGVDFFGGDLQGVMDKLDPYLKKQLGVTAIYFNPIFQSPSNSKYDTQNYFKVDPHFGSNQQLARLIQDAHATNRFTGDYRMSVILDGVFNHTGTWSPWFNEQGIYKQPGAYQSQSSPYYGYYAFPQWPGNYCDWSGYLALPKLNYSSTALQNAIYAGPHSVMQTYLKAPYHIDGWRYDVPDNLTAITDAATCSGPSTSNTQIWTAARQDVKKVNPNALMLGEIWTVPTPFLEGNEMDSVMNYNGFGFPVAEWLTGKDMHGNALSITPTQLDAWLHGTLADNNRQSNLSAMNSLGTHDTTRFLTLANDNVNVMKEAIELQMTYVGSPSIYYGDEIGMQGGNDPDNRRTFNWNKSAWNMPIFNTYKTLIAFRKKTTALQDGTFITLDADNANNVYAYGRGDPTSSVIVALNNNTTPVTVTLDATQLSLTDGTVLTDVLTGHQYTVSGGNVTITSLPGQTGVVLATAPLAHPKPIRHGAPATHNQAAITAELPRR